MNNAYKNPTLKNATCPACGLLCDDIEVSASQELSVKNACSKGVTFFKRADTDSDSFIPRLNGKPCDLQTAVNRAVEILSGSVNPLIAGLGTEVQGARSLMRLAQHINATIDHMHGESSMRNTRVLQNSGWITTTLAEVKNRADLILAIGTDISSTHPRFFERLTESNDRLFRTQATEVIYLGAEKLDPGKSDPEKSDPDKLHGEKANTGKDDILSSENRHQLPEILNALNAILLGKKLTDTDIGGVALGSLLTLAEKLKKAQYAVIVWSAANLNFPHAELMIQAITRLIAKLNETTRAAGLPLNSGDGDTSVNNVSTWLCGYPARLKFNNGVPDYNSSRHSIAKQTNQCDALVWVSCFNPHLPPQTEAPTIVIGHPGMQFEKVPDVFIPVGVPGFDTSGLMFRMDSSITLPLKKINDRTLPSLEEVIAMTDAKLCAAKARAGENA